MNLYNLLSYIHKSYIDDDRDPSLCNSINDLLHICLVIKKINTDII